MYIQGAGLLLRDPNRTLRTGLMLHMTLQETLGDIGLQDASAAVLSAAE